MKLTALVSALVVWFFVASQDLEQRIFVEPLEFLHQPKGTRFSWRTRPPKDVVLTVRGRSRRAQALQGAQIKVYLDLQDVVPGKKKTLDVHVQVPQGIMVQALDPIEVEVLLISK